MRAITHRAGGDPGVLRSVERVRRREAARQRADGTAQELVDVG